MRLTPCLSWMVGRTPHQVTSHSLSQSPSHSLLLSSLSVSLSVSISVSVSLALYASEEDMRAETLS